LAVLQGRGFDVGFAVRDSQYGFAATFLRAFPQNAGGNRAQICQSDRSQIVLQLL
jgi:hypothetical protein